MYTKRLNDFKISCKRTAAIIKKNKIYYLKPPVLIFGLLFPLVMFLAFAIGRDINLIQLTPGMLGITALFTASSVGPLITPWERMMKTHERLITTPLTQWNIILGDIFSGTVFGLIIALVPLAAGLFVFQTTITNFVTFIITLLITTFCFSTLGSLMSSLPTEMPANVMMLSNLIRFPLLFISGVFIPLTDMPTWAVTISHLSPLTYAVELFRFSFGLDITINFYLCFAVLVGFTILFLLWNKRAHERSIKNYY